MIADVASGVIPAHITDSTIPSDATTVPPGTPGAPTANIPSKTINNIIIGTGGIAPTLILYINITKNVSVRTEPQR